MNLIDTYAYYCQEENRTQKVKVYLTMDTYGDITCSLSPTFNASQDGMYKMWEVELDEKDAIKIDQQRDINKFSTDITITIPDFAKYK